MTQRITTPREGSGADAWLPGRPIPAPLRRPSASTATASTRRWWRPSSAGAAVGLAGSQISTRPSSPPVTTRPSSSIATVVTELSWRPTLSERRTPDFATVDAANPVDVERQRAG